MSKRKRPDSKSSVDSLNEQHEKELLDLIKSKKESGATITEMKDKMKEIDKNIIQAMLTRSVNGIVKSLMKKKLIKEVPTKSGTKHYLAMEFEPSEEVTGGDWYINGTLDLSKIEDLKEKCKLVIERQRHRVVTLEVMCAYFRKAENLKDDQTKEILNNLILDNVIMEVTSTGLNEFASTRIGDPCYKLTSKKSNNGEVRVGAFASVPCGACPNIGICSPDGVISPTTCVYFQKWLLDF